MITKDGKIITVDGKGLTFESLVTQANEVTGKDDKTVKDAIQSLCDKINGGASISFVPIAPNTPGLNRGTYEGIDTFTIDTSTQPGHNVPYGNVKGVRKLRYQIPTNLNTMSQWFIRSAFEEIEIIGSTHNITNFDSCFAEEDSLKRIVGEIDFASANSVTYIFSLCKSLEEVRFVPNTLTIDLRIYTTATTVAFSNESFISLANCLSPSVSGKTLSIDLIYYQYIPTIMGYNDNGLFVESEDGTLSLSDFITNIKGWTLGVA